MVPLGRIQTYHGLTEMLDAYARFDFTNGKIELSDGVLSVLINFLEIPAYGLRNW